MNSILKFLIPLFFLFFSFCKNSGSHTAERYPYEDTVILVGTASLDSLNNPPFDAWYKPGLLSASPDLQKVEEFKPLLKEVEILAFIGTWCEDSQREVPKFVKILEAAGYPLDQVEVVMMSREKTTPQNYEEGLNITNVPTFIFYKNGQEMNRIVEFPIEDLESDMMKILKGEPYKHAYEWD
jgi:thiol-disulfide isomerase/thioredoxin